MKRRENNQLECICLEKAQAVNYTKNRLETERERERDLQMGTPPKQPASRHSKPCILLHKLIEKHVKVYLIIIHKAEARVI